MKRYFFAIATLSLLAVVWQLAPRGGEALAQQQGWGTVKGQIVYAGDDVPKREPLKVDKDQQHCLAEGPILEEDWVVDPKTNGVRDVYIWLEPVNKGDEIPVHPSLKGTKEAVVMDQPHCQFVPHAVGLQQGQVLIAKNSAPIAHNFKWTGHPLRNPGGNRLMPANSDFKIENLKADPFPIRVECNIHPWMKGWIRVFDHPYFAVTPKTGAFELKNAPAGQYKLKVWHGGSGWLGGAKGREGLPITIKADGTTDLGELKIGPAA